MLIAFGCVTLLALALIASLAYVLRCQREERAQWAVERRELLERIQRPERVPVTVEREPFEVPDQQPDGWAQVGQVVSIDDDYGTSDDG